MLFLVNLVTCPVAACKEGGQKSNITNKYICYPLSYMESAIKTLLLASY